MAQSSIELWGDFLHRYCWEEILRLACDFPARRSLIINFHDVERFDFELGAELIEHPDAVLKQAHEALWQIDLPAEVDIWLPHVRISELPEKIRRRDLRKKDLNHLICLDGIVNKSTEIYPKIVNAAFKCHRCGHMNHIPQDNYRFIEPFECEDELCGRKNAFKLLLEESEKVDAQRLRLAELPEDLEGGEKSQTVDANLYDDLAGIVLPGNRVTVVGILRAHQVVKPTGKTTVMELYIDALHVQVNDKRDLITLSSEDKLRLQTLAEQPDVVDTLVSAFAPTIQGMEALKEGILCSASSNGLSFRSDGTPQREYSHLLAVTDPSMGKTNLKFALKKLMPDVVLSSGTGSTKAGLLAAAVKDDFAGGSWSIEAGVLPLADKSGAVIDEMDKFSKEEYNQLNDALSNCQFEVSKAGFQLKLWTRCFVIALMNPKSGRFDPYELEGSQIVIPPDTLSRFDLIFALKDTPNQDLDAVIADKMLDAWQGNGDEHEPVLSADDLMKYLAFARSIKIEDKFEQDVDEKMKRWYLMARKRSDPSGRVAVTARYLESLARLAKAEARLHLSKTVKMAHLDRAIKLLEASVMSFGVNEKGEWDADVRESGMSKSQRDKVCLMLKIIKEGADENRGTAPLGEIVLRAQEEGFKDMEIKPLLDRLKHNGDIIEVAEGKFRVVS